MTDARIIGRTIQVSAQSLTDVPDYRQITLESVTTSITAEARHHGMQLCGPVRCLGELPKKLTATGHLDDHGEPLHILAGCAPEDADMYELVYEATAVPATQETP